MCKEGFVECFGVNVFGEKFKITVSQAELDDGMAKTMPIQLFPDEDSADIYIRELAIKRKINRINFLIKNTGDII